MKIFILGRIVNKNLFLFQGRQGAAGYRVQGGAGPLQVRDEEPGPVLLQPSRRQAGQPRGRRRGHRQTLLLPGGRYLNVNRIF